MKHGVDRAISGLRWTLSLVVLCEALHFAFSPASARHFAHFGLPRWIRPALAWSEAAAALLFLTPMTTVVGGYALLLIFFAAVTIHFYGCEWSVGTLLVYVMATVVSIAQARPKAEGGEDD